MLCQKVTEFKSSVLETIMQRHCFSSICAPKCAKTPIWRGVLLDLNTHSSKILSNVCFKSLCLCLTRSWQVVSLSMTCALDLLSRDERRRVRAYDPRDADGQLGSPISLRRKRSSRDALRRPEAPHQRREGGRWREAGPAQRPAPRRAASAQVPTDVGSERDSLNQFVMQDKQMKPGELQAASYFCMSRNS